MSNAVDAGQAEIYDRGYRPYNGPRTNVGGSMKAVVVSSIQRALGLRRKFRFKIVPLLTIFIAYVPALVFMGVGILLPEEFASEVVAEYAEYFGLISIAVTLFTAFVVPELMSTDRRTGLFGLYMASPLGKSHYLASKVLALLGVLLTVTMFPVLFLLAGYSFTGLGPDGFVNTVELVARILGSGVLMALFFVLFGMAASTLTDRQGFASAGIVIVIIASGVLTSVLFEVAEFSAWIQVFNLTALPLDLIARLFGEEIAQLEGVSTTLAIGAYVGMCALFLAIIMRGYQRLEVTK